MIMRAFIFICFIIVTGQYAHAADYEMGVSINGVMLQGDLDTASDPGYAGSVSFLRNLNSFVGIGIRAGVEYVSGTTTVGDYDPVYKGDHEYTAIMIPAGILTRIKPNFALPFQPYIEGEIGALTWYPDHEGPAWRLPTKTAVEWAVTPFGGIGGGLIIPFGARWCLDLHGSFRYVFDDRLDSIDSEVIGGSSGNDTIVTGGIALIYRFDNSRPAGKMQTVVAPALPQNMIVHTEIDDEARETNEDFDGVMDEDIVAEADADTTIITERDLRPETPAPAVVSVPQEYYTLLAASYKSASDAQSAAAMYKQRGMDVAVFEEQMPNMEVWRRVYLGRYDSDEEATRAANTVMEEMGVGYIRIFKHSIDGNYIPGREITLDSFYVHVSSFKVQENAIEDQKRFNQAGYDTLIRQVDLGEKGVWYRVIVGPYASKTDASGVAARITTAGLSDYTVIIQ